MIRRFANGGSDPDLALVRATQGGDDAAFSELMARHEQPVFRTIWRSVQHEQDARDLAQETFVRAYLGIGKFTPDAKFTTWLYRIALNLCRDHARSKQHRMARVTEPLPEHRDESEGARRELASPLAAPAEGAMERERMAAVELAIAELPPELKPAFVLAVMEERSHIECAELLEISAKAVETRVYRARKILEEKLRRFLKG